MDSQTTITNCSNNYGPYQFPEKLIPLTIINILLGKPLPVYGDGLQVRDWLHVEDHCAAIALALERGRPGEVYNIGGNSETTNIEIVRTLCGLVDEAMGERAGPARGISGLAGRQWQAGGGLDHPCARPPGHDRRYAIDFGRRHASWGTLRAAIWPRGCVRRSTGIWLIRVGGRRCWGATTRTGWRRITSVRNPSVKLERALPARVTRMPRTGYDVRCNANGRYGEVVSESEVVTEMVDAN